MGKADYKRMRAKGSSAKGRKHSIKLGRKRAIRK